MMEKVWVNGTNLKYFFFKDPAYWRGGQNQEQAVRHAFATWKDIGIGLTFQEVDSPEEATIKIGFDQNDGSWSYVGRDCLEYAKAANERSMNFGWDLTTPYGRDTALHEIGHAIGFPHEHQNPLAGIVWDEEKVYESLGGPPNNWSRDETYWNIIRKIPANSVDGSDWDKNSIMHYQFEAGLIKEPSEYRTRPLIPEAGLSELDIETAKRLYPTQEARIPELRAFESQHLMIGAGKQVDFLIKPEISRKYTLQTFGAMDTVMVLFEIWNDEEVFLAGDDDSGQDYNAKINLRLLRGRQYVVRTRLYYSNSAGNGSIMLY
ncbi:M12 family metallopeptidase [Methylomonas sp.]|jgi:hypothetical protein|uniref:M12 family metallopeptidase n=1 Tax=Methylomonas sp. TaxID=418 RepID=UPI0025F97608|nr:M12 family metallopeptidase [Methylomonas sp.]